jgi:hypothetical protein
LQTDIGKIVRIIDSSYARAGRPLNQTRMEFHSAGELTAILTPGDRVLSSVYESRVIASTPFAATKR